MKNKQTEKQWNDLSKYYQRVSFPQRDRPGFDYYSTQHDKSNIFQMESNSIKHFLGQMNYTN